MAKELNSLELEMLKTKIKQSREELGVSVEEVDDEMAKTVYDNFIQCIANEPKGRQRKLISQLFYGQG